MTETRIKISSIVENQLPQFVLEEFPLVSEFLSQYYTSLESQGNVSDILQNIDQYVKVDQLTNLIDSTTLTADVTFFDTTINVSSTAGFPDSYGLLLIDSEIITYKSKTSTTFEGCVRGFSGVTSYKIKDELTFAETESQEHNAIVNDIPTEVTNLSILFLKEFLIKVKKQVTPGFEERELYSELNENVFIKQSIDFYSSKGTDRSFKILFGALYGENVEIIKPRDYLIRASDAQYRITSDLVVESIEGNPENLINTTLYQDETEFTNSAQGTITKVEEIRRGDKNYYVISLDSDYDKDIQPIGSVYGKFQIHPKTQIVSPILSGSTTLEVDSTVAFPSSNGRLVIDLENGTTLNVNYTSKNLNQFLGCSGINQNISASTEVKIDSFAYGYFNNTKVKIRILGVLSDLELKGDTSFCSKGDIIRIKNLGIDLKDDKSNNWFYNIPTRFDVSSIELLDSADRSYKVDTYENHSFKIGDSVTLLSSTGTEKISNVISFNNKKSFSIQFGSEEGLLDLNQVYVAKKNLSKVNSNIASVNNYTSNVQNVYSDREGSLYIASPSIPTYLNRPLRINDRSITFSGSFNGTILNIGIHGFYTGDSIVYKPTVENSLGISTGIYFVKKVSDSEIKLAKSRSNIFTENFVSVNGSVTNAKFELTDFTYKDLSSQELESQKLIRKISEPEIDGNNYKTEPGLTGIFINGVELLNYKSKDNVYYGNIEKIIPSSPGSGYDIINPPILSITDPQGSGASGYCSVIGGLERIDIIHPGFDYIEDPEIEITGGNGVEASAKINLESFDYQVSFNSIASAELVKLNPTNTVGFSSYHKFRDAEEVIYITDGQSPVGGLSINSTYFVSVQDAYNVKLHKSLEDAVSGINTIQLTSYGVGNHSFKSRNKKRKIGSITIENSGSNYQNKLVVTGPTGINTASNSITISNHGYESGEIIVYNATDSSVGGLSSSSSYYVTKINENEFKLSSIGIGTAGITTSFYYETKQYIDLTSTGTSTHKFNYPEIKVSVKGKIGVSTLSGQDFNAVIQPIFRGGIESVFLTSGGSNYGSDILNYNRQPLFELDLGSGIELKPIVSNGRIVDVLINSAGSNYNSPPNLQVIGDGAGAILTPILSNGTLSEVKVISGGGGYGQSNTSIDVTPAGSGAKFEAQIKAWKVNLVERLIQNSQITDDDGILDTGLNVDYGLEYCHAYAPRNLRSSVQGIRFSEGEEIRVVDLQISDNNIEIAADGSGGSRAHSPIIGWAYDGNPIYGPYGYSGGLVKSLKPGYELIDTEDRVNGPDKSIYPLGFFVEDYVYTGNGDLDEHNGKFGVTPEYPNGVYAYFATINSGSPEVSGVFARGTRYKRPIFPYLIGDSYKSKPIEFNFYRYSNQDNIDINQTGWKRNITPYNISSYEYLFDSNRIKSQNSIIRSVSKGFINSVGVETGGRDYKIGDKLIFDEKSGFGSKAKISSLRGKNVNQISVSTLSFNDVVLYPSDDNQFIGFTTISHGFSNNDIVTFTGKFDYKKSGKINVTRNNLTLTTGVGSAVYTGDVTFFNVSGNLNYPNIKENDIYQIGNEEVKVLNIDSSSSRIKVLRNQNGTTGISTYSAGIALTEKTRRFKINFGISTSYNFDINKEFYFDPKESVGLGTTSGVGIVSTIYFSNPGVGLTQITIPTQSIYIKDHSLNTGDSLIYSSNGGNRISVSTDGLSSFILGEKSIVYVAKITNDLIGISTIRVGLGSTGTFVAVGSTTQSGILYFTSVGTGNTHSFKTNYTNTLSGQISKNVVTVSTAETHGLSLLDNVTINAKPGISTTIIVKYNDYNRRLVINPRTFASIDTTDNIISIDNHKYYTGQKVIYTATTPATGLDNNKMYYVVVIDPNKIKLSNSYYQATNINPETIDITSSQPGTLSPVNPPLNLIKNQTTIFDLSDSSLSFIFNQVPYSAFELKFYKDDKFVEEFNTTKSSTTFEVVRSGKVGIDSTANTTLSLNDNIPINLYYKLVPINIDTNSQVKKDILIDNDVVGFNKITLTESLYNGKQVVIGITSTTFNYNILELPEVSSYNQGIEYYVDNSVSAKGPIQKVKLLSSGKNYSTLPLITSIESESGSDSILSLETSEIGSILTTEIEDIGFNYSADYSVRPSAKPPTILVLEPFSSLDYIGITSAGKNYTSAPTLVVIDSLTNKVIKDIELSYNLGDSKVTINKNSTSINNIIPKIVPTNNSNGFKINNISFNNVTKDVTVTLGASFSDPEDYPFEVGGRVFIEGVSVGTATTLKGYNSKNYDYSLFTLTGIDPNIGGAVGVVTYNLSEYLNSGEIPGTFNGNFSAGKIIPESHFPIFNPVLKKNTFYRGEIISSSSSSKGSVESWDPDTQNLKISTTDDFGVGENIQGETSNSNGLIKKVISFELDYEINSSSDLRKGWNTEIGFLNNDFQRIHDNDYYQYFSYVLRSQKDLNTWDSPVSSLNHTAGFKRFGNILIESEPTNAGISTNQNEGDFLSTLDLSRFIDLNCVYDFDLARENNLLIDDQIRSNEISFNSRVIQDYIESIGNRVLIIDDITDEFNSNPRATEFSIAQSFILADFRTKKYFSLVQDKNYSQEKQFNSVVLLHDNNVGFINQYGLNTLDRGDLGFFDFSISGIEANLLFYPTKPKINDYHIELFAFSLNESVSGIGTVDLGDSVKVNTYNSIIPQGTGISTTIVGIASTYRSSKILVQIGATDSSYYEVNEITVLNDGNDIHLLEYGKLTTDIFTSQSSAGIGTYNAYLSGSQIKIDLIPYQTTSVDYIVNSINISIASTNSSGTDTQIIGGSSINSFAVAISSSPSPGANIVASYSNNDHNGSYLIISAEDKTNSKYQVSEFLVATNSSQNECYFTEFGPIQTHSHIGIITAGISGSDTNIYFTPNENIDVDVKVFSANVGLSQSPDQIFLTNGEISYSYSEYTGTNNDIKKDFDLTHQNVPIFKRNFSSGDVGVVNLEEDIIKIPNNFYVTGEEIIYSHPSGGSFNPIGIATTTIPGIGSTDKLPRNLYVVRLNDMDIRVSASASDALKSIPNVLDLTSTGIGTHTFTSKNQNKKAIISVDNLIQTPIVSTAITTTLVKNMGVFDSEVYVSGISSIYSGDFIKIDEEIMKVNSVGIGSTNSILVIRPWMGTGISTHSSSSVVTKVYGNYNIVDSKIHFASPPFGKVPFMNLSNRFDEMDYIGISTGSTFNGRVFLRSGITDSFNESYSNNYIFDDISDNFDGINETYTLKSNQENVAGISTDNAILLINNIFQTPSSFETGDYSLNENSGITTVTFTGTASSTSYDVNTASVPRGGVILSVGSTTGFGYQPLVAAGGTAIVSSAGTIQSISIGNSGSGYRPGIQTVVNVAVATSSTGSPTIQFIGTAAISNGHIVGVAITNPGMGYTFTNPPVVIFDSPLSYSNIPLIYSPNSPSGSGVGAFVDIIVGQGSSVISFDFKNLGYGYRINEVLTVSIGGTTGIPTNTSLPLSNFEITIDDVFTDNFAAWTVGSLQVIDSFDSLFDGTRTIFPIKIGGNQTTIRSKKGSNIDVQATLLVFINDVLQVPGQSYIFNGGSFIKFTEAPKEGDKSRIVFYRGTDGVDTELSDILETIKVGDVVTLNSDNIETAESGRLVNEIISSDTLETELYSGQGISRDENLLRPLKWCRQTEDLFINGQAIGKDRILYEPYIQPNTNIIQNIGIGSTQIFVESVKSFFDSKKEYVPNGISEKPQNKILIISQDSVVSASATAVVSTSGTISSIVISDGGVGYTTTPTVSISAPVGFGTTAAQNTSRSVATVSGGSVTGIAVTFGGSGYTEPPIVLIESPTIKYEVIDGVSYEGDFGIITGINTTSVGVASTGIVFDFFIPNNSVIRDTKVSNVGIATTGISGIQTGYYFVVSNSNIGNGLTSINESGGVVGVGTTFIDNIYQVASVSIAQTAVPGVGITNVAKVTVSVSNYNNLTGLGFSNFYGNYSWGRILIPTRIDPQEFTSYANISGISTSPVVQRFNKLKFIGYSIS